MKIPVLLMARELNLGGSERQMTETARFLDRSIFEPHVGCFRPAGMRGDDLRDAGVPVVEFPVMSYRSAAALTETRHLARYVRERGIQIVHAWDHPLNIWAVPAARTMTRAVAMTSRRAHRDLIPPAQRPLASLADRMAHSVVVNCDYLRKHVANDENISERKIRVCHNGIDLDRFTRVPVEPHPLTIGVVCALRPEKDLKTLIRGFASARKSAGEIELLIVGSGDDLAILKQYVREAGVEPVAHFEPATPDVPRWLSRIDIFVLPSRSEALSNSLMEAMACGCCAVASNVGGNPELVRDRETGLLFRPGDSEDLAASLRTLIESPSLRGDLATRGEAMMRESFSIQSAARRMGEIYQSELGRRRTS